MNGFIVRHKNLKGEQIVSELLPDMIGLQIYTESLIGFTHSIEVSQYKVCLLNKTVVYTPNTELDIWEKK